MSTMPSISRRVIDSIIAVMSGRAASATPEPKPMEPELRGMGASAALFRNGLVENYYRMMEKPGERRLEMRFYDYLERELSDVPRALEAFATMACTGTLTGASEGTFSVTMPPDAPQDLKDHMAFLNDVVSAEIYPFVRGMAKYGSFPALLVPGVLPSGKMGVTDLNPLPPGTMYRNLKGGPEKYWKVVNPDMSAGPELPRWRVPHFAMWTSIVNAEYTQVYGTSMLAPVGRIGLMLSSAEDAMLVARLSRAAMRYKVMIDVSDLGSDDDRIFNRMDRVQQHHERQRQLYKGGGLDSFQKAQVPEGDFYSPAGKNLAHDITTVTGDTNVGNIKDVEFFLQRYFGALGVPAAYLGYAAGSSGRSSLTQVDVQFARSARYLQLFASGALKHIAVVHMMLGGFDPDLWMPIVATPSIGARDELLHAQVRMLQSQVVKNLFAAGFDPSTNARWVLETLMNMGAELEDLSEEEIAGLFREMPMMPPGGSTGAGGSGGSTGGSTGAAREDVLQAAMRGIEPFIHNFRMTMLMGRAAAAEQRIARHQQPSTQDLRDDWCTHG